MSCTLTHFINIYVVHNMNHTMPSARALLIGVNYRGTSNELRGCIADAHNLKDYLLTQAFAPDEKMLLIEEATRVQIIQGIKRLAKQSHDESLDKVIISYSGHGSYAPCCRCENEVDGRTETICPYDFERAGQITDDELNQLLKSFNPSTRVVAIFDSCHSSSILDLEHTFNPVSCAREVHVETSKTVVSQNVTCISGCMDSDISADAYDEATQRFAGAMTCSLLYCLRSIPSSRKSAGELVRQMRKKLKHDGFPQVPQLSSSQQVNFDVPFI